MILKESRASIDYFVGPCELSHADAHQARIVQLSPRFDKSLPNSGIQLLVASKCKSRQVESYSGPMS